MTSAEDRAVAFCRGCGQICPDPIPEPGHYWRCTNCNKRRRILRADPVHRLKVLMTCVRNPIDAVANPAIDGLVVFREQVFGPLLTEIKRRPQRAYEIGAAMGRINKEMAFEMLMKQMPNSKWSACVTLVAASPVLVITLIFSIASHAFAPFLFGLVFGLTLFGLGRSLVASAALGVPLALCGLGDVRAVGPLARAYDSAHLPKGAKSGLQSLFEKVEERNAGDFRKEDLEILETLCMDVDAGFAIAAIRALGNVGNEDTKFDNVLKIATVNSDRGKAAYEARKNLKEAIARRKEAKTLLRAADSEDMDPKRLLRPATEGETHTDQLLRPADRDAS
jgi:hypothetical protein